MFPRPLPALEPRTEAFWRACRAGRLEFAHCVPCDFLIHPARPICPRCRGRNLDTAVVSGRDVRKGKPDPEVFLVAASRLGVPPANCVVIEDAPAGVQAAKAAGMACVALLSRGRRRDDFAAIPPDRFVQSLRDISPAMLHQLIDA